MRAEWEQQSRIDTMHAIRLFFSMVEFSNQWRDSLVVYVIQGKIHLGNDLSSMKLPQKMSRNIFDWELFQNRWRQKYCKFNHHVYTVEEWGELKFTHPASSFLFNNYECIVYVAITIHQNERNRCRHWLHLWQPSLDFNRERWRFFFKRFGITISVKRSFLPDDRDWVSSVRANW